MNRSTERILTTHVGSLPRPDGLDEQLTALDRGTLGDGDRQALPQRVADAVASVVSRQAQIGIDLVSDGEMSKYGYATYVKQRLTGLDGDNVALALSEFADFPGFAMKTPLVVTNPACTGPVSYRGGDAARTDIATLQAALQTVPGAGAFMNAATPGIIAEYQVNQYYASDDEYLSALADAMKQEYDLIAQAGLTVQLDAPDLALGRHLRVPPLSVEEFRRQTEQRVELINHATRDIAPEQLRLHICWGNYDSPHHHDIPLADILDVILRARPATLLFEAANPRHEHEWQVFEEVALPEGKVIVPGVIDTLTSYIEHPELVAQRIVRYADLVGRENVIAGTDCGFATFANFMNIHPEVAWAKLRALVEGAELASRRLWGAKAQPVTAEAVAS
ncbi:MAG: 5-methyltetrahydropteroyltriglutamate--homocysteine methyltransferase [Solirubrobacteraceae bacterium]